MARIARILVGAAAVATGVSVAGAAFAASRQEHRHPAAASHHRPTATGVSSAPVRTVVVYPSVAYPLVRYAPAYPSSYYGTSRQPLTFSRSPVPPVYFVPAISPNAPPFSFSESVEQPGWNWERVSLQQIDAEVRARRAAKEAGTAPKYRKYCPDTRAYYPEVSQCASEWLIVVSKATASAATQSEVANR